MISLVKSKAVPTTTCIDHPGGQETINKIFLAANAGGGSAPVGHLQVVGKQDDLSSIEIEVQKTADDYWTVEGVIEDRSHDNNANTPGYGVAGLYSQVEIDIGDRNPDDVWKLLKQAAIDIEASKQPYLLLFNNSNTFVNTLLHAIGVNVSSYLDDVTPSQVSLGFWASDIDAANRPAVLYPAITFTIAGTVGDDIFYGGWGNDNLVGGAGRDSLYGGRGDDVIIAGNLNGQNGPAAPGVIQASEMIDGGAGSDYLVVTGPAGTTVTVGEGSSNDRLLVHADFVGFSNTQIDGIQLFALLGGVASFSSEQTEFGVVQDMDANLAFNVDTGEAYRIFNYIPPDSQVFVAVEYHYYVESRRLEILVFDNNGDHRKIVVPEFDYGDYGITLGLFFPQIHIPGGDDNGATFINDDGQIDALAAAIAANSKHALAFSLSPDTGDITPQRMTTLAAAAQPEITVDNLRIAIDGTGDDDTLRGTNLDELIDGHDGDDHLIGRGGNDRMDGGAGNDALNGGEGADALDGGEGVDRANYVHSPSGVAVDLALGTGADGDAEGDTLIGVEQVLGSAFADQLTGDAENNRLVGNGGNDVLAGGAGSDTLDGGDGADALGGGDGVDRATYIDSAAAVIVNLALGTGSGGEAEGDTLIGIEQLLGSAHADRLTGDTGVNRLTGNEGDDVLDGGEGNDVLVGSAGADTLIGGAGDRDAADYRQASEGVALSLASGGAVGEASGDTYSGIEDVHGSDHADTIVGDQGSNRVVAGNGDDVLDGAEGNDTLIGGGGNDTMTGELGADIFVFEAASGHDAITDFWAGPGRTDRVRFSASQFTDFASVMNNASQNGGDVVISIDAENTIVLLGVQLSQLQADDFLFA